MSDPTPPSDAPAPQTPADAETPRLAEKPVPPAGEYSASAGRYYRNVRYLILAAAVFMGCYFLYDGFIAWPESSERYTELQEQIETVQATDPQADVSELLREQEQYDFHPEFDIWLQKVLGFALLPLAGVLAFRWFYISRGRVRLDEQDVLHAPGHPPVPASAITGWDDSRWDRKGISYISYRLESGSTGRIKLDDFVYERGPIDQIHDRLKHLADARAFNG